MSQIEETSPVPVRAEMTLGRRLTLIALSSLVLLLVILAGAAYAGYQAGLTQRNLQFQATQSADLQHQYELGLADLQSGQYEVAEARFAYILQLDPDYRDASQKLADARQGQLATATLPPAQATATVTPTSPPAANAAAEVYTLAQDYYAAGDWDNVIKEVSRLHAIDPDYEAVRVDGMLYVALRNRGIARILGDAMESGMFDLDQAGAFGPLDTEALNYRAWARLYLAAQSYWGINWKQSMDILEQLYLIAPYFRDTSTRLYRSRVNYAGQLVAAGDYCGAAERYTAAQALFADDPPVAASLAEAQAACAQTPTPDPLATPAGGEATSEPSATPGG